MNLQLAAGRGRSGGREARRSGGRRSKGQDARREVGQEGSQEVRRFAPPRPRREAAHPPRPSAPRPCRLPPPPPRTSTERPTAARRALAGARGRTRRRPHLPARQDARSRARVKRDHVRRAAVPVARGGHTCCFCGSQSAAAGPAEGMTLTCGRGQQVPGAGLESSGRALSLLCGHVPARALCRRSRGTATGSSRVGAPEPAHHRAGSSWP